MPHSCNPLLLSIYAKQGLCISINIPCQTNVYLAKILPHEKNDNGVKLGAKLFLRDQMRRAEMKSLNESSQSGKFHEEGESGHQVSNNGGLPMRTWITVILNGLPWKRTEIIMSFLRLHPITAFQTLLLTRMATPFLLRDSCPQQQIKWSSELHSPIPIHFSSLIPKMSMFTLAISQLIPSNSP